MYTMEEFKNLAKNSFINIVEKECRIRELERDRENLKIELEDLEIDPDDFEDELKDFIDDRYGPINIAGVEYQASAILLEFDPTHYHQCLNDYVDTNVHVTDTDEYKELEEKIESLDLVIGDLETDIQDIIKEVSELENSIIDFPTPDRISIFNTLEHY